jgi:hypothetical protein
LQAELAASGADIGEQEELPAETPIVVEEAPAGSEQAQATA